MMRSFSSLYTQRWYVYLVSCAPWKRYSITLCLLILGGAGWLLGVYYPLEQTRISYEQKLHELQCECHACAGIHEACKQLECSIQLLQGTLQQYVSNDVCPLVLCIECAQKAGLVVHSSTMGHHAPSSAQATAGRRTTQKELITLEISGTYSAYMTFLNLLSQLPHVICYEHMHIEYDASPNQLRATCLLGFITV